MGQRIVALAAKDPQLSIVSAIDSPTSPVAGRDAGELAGIGKLGVPITSEVRDSTDVIIDFSTPEATVKLKVGTAAAPDSPWGQVFKTWRKAVEQKTSNAVSFDFYFNSTQGTEATMVDKIKAVETSAQGPLPGDVPKVAITIDKAEMVQ